VRDLVEAGSSWCASSGCGRFGCGRKRAAEDRLVDLLVVASSGVRRLPRGAARTLKRQLREELLEDHEVELEVSESRMPTLDMFTPQGIESMGIDLKDMFGGMFGRKARKRMRVAEARRILLVEEEDRLIDRSQVEQEALRRVEQAGIVFSTRSTRSRRARTQPAGPTSPARACSGTCCRSSKDRP